MSIFRGRQSLTAAPEGPTVSLPHSLVGKGTVLDDTGAVTLYFTGPFGKTISKLSVEM